MADRIQLDTDNGPVSHRSPRQCTMRMTAVLGARARRPPGQVPTLPRGGASSAWDVYDRPGKVWRRTGAGQATGQPACHLPGSQISASPNRASPRGQPSWPRCGARHLSSAPTATSTSTQHPSRRGISHWRARCIKRCPPGSEGGCTEKALFIPDEHGTSPCSPPYAGESGRTGRRIQLVRSVRPRAVRHLPRQAMAPDGPAAIRPEVPGSPPC
jgi:hypothetical protein